MLIKLMLSHYFTQLSGGLSNEFVTLGSGGEGGRMIDGSLGRWITEGWEIGRNDCNLITRPNELK